ncbi:MAG: hypothetical protein R2818_15665 [Flavobacteriales bacterium]
MIREGVYRAVQAYPLFYARLEAREVTPLHRIGHEVAHRHQRVAAREVEVAEIVHGVVRGVVVFAEFRLNAALFNEHWGAGARFRVRGIPVLGVQGTSVRIDHRPLV